MGEATNEVRIIATCPVCKHEYKTDGKSKLLMTSYMVAQGQHGQQIAMAISLPKIACIECGVEFFAGEALEELRKKAKGEVSSIVIPKSSIKLN